MPKYVIEVSGPQNECAIFSPLQLKLRGRWEFANVSHRDKTEAMKVLAKQCHTIPGQIIVLDTDEKEGSISDPLLVTKDGQVLFEKIRQVFKDYAFEFGGDKKPQETQIHQLTTDQIKTWAFCMRSMVDTGIAREPSSVRLPAAEDISAWPGKRMRDPGNTGTQEKDLKKFVDEVPEPTVRGGKGAATAQQSNS